jgi:tRNA threonylcarbamoyladenosine biosynthesis protein TsaE
MQSYILKGESETLDFSKKIAALINKSKLSAFEFHLQGDLGTGKTTLVRGVLRALGWSGSVKSPTYTICEEYEFHDLLILHIDLYRTDDDEDVDMLMLNRDYDGKKLIFIEWSEKIKKQRDFSLMIKLKHHENSRRIEISGDTILLNKLKG